MSQVQEITFRDRLTTVNKKGERVWVYPKKPKGNFHRKRVWVAWACISLLVIVPFVKIKGHPLLMLNILERKFVIFGTVFWPQDFFILLLVMLSIFVSIILFTAIFGRIWCGWLCPQTVFMEMVFRKIDYWIEGDFQAQIKLNNQTWDIEKLWKKGVKHLIYLVISAFIGHLVMSYIVGVEEMQTWLKSSTSINKTYLLATWIFVFIFYLVFSKLRELACTIVCPYGRLQSVLTSKSTVNVIYDFLRGEPRGKITKENNTLAHGDCVDCGLCVKVCPTNIDIRNGTQLECINCTACIDACDEVMLKTHKPLGLIRYDSENGIAFGEKWRFTPRIAFYSFILFALMFSISFFLYSRSNLKVKMMRLPGATFQVLDNGKIRNIYQLQVANKSFDKLKIELMINDEKANLQLVGGELWVEPESKANGVVMIDLNADASKNNIIEIRPQILVNGEIFMEVNTKFIKPSQKISQK
ncbi:MAG: cytochrome c oxidase accessory protein CcoG [Cytophagales bacterium]